MAFLVTVVVLGAVVIVSAVRRRERLFHIFPLPFVLLVAVLAIVFVGVSLNGALLVRFELSRGSLESAAAQVQAGSTPRTPERIGYFTVREIDQAGGSVRFIVGEAMLDDIGFAYSPNGKPPIVGEDMYWHLHGDWWLWQRSW